MGRKPFNIGDSEKLRYCEMDIKDAPGLRDARRASAVLPASLLLDSHWHHVPWLPKKACCTVQTVYAEHSAGALPHATPA